MKLYNINKLLNFDYKYILFTFSLNFVCITLFASVNEPLAVPGEYIVKIKSSEAPQVFSNLAIMSEHLNAEITSIIPKGKLMVVHRPAIETQASVIKSLSESPFIEYAEPNYIYHHLAQPNDLSYGKQWALKNTLNGGVDIGAEAAWDITTGSDQVVVGIIDSGIDYNSPELKSNIWINQAEAAGKPGVDDDQNGYVDDIYGVNLGRLPGINPTDDNGHGSHCAGTIGASGNDGVGITGINWKVKLMGLKFLDSEGAGTLETAVKAIDYAIKMKVKILSNSWGSYEVSKALQEAIERANQAGILFVAAAGNDGLDNELRPVYPASYKIPNVIAVAASSERGELAGFSNFGKNFVHLAAPGVSIYSLWKNGELANKSGTSMAAPFVAGIAALLLSHEPQLTHLELKERLMKTSVPKAAFRNTTISGGLVNAFFALKNEVPPMDQDDPANWKSIPVQISSEHPYKPQTKKVYEINVPGAKQIALYLEKFETEFQNDSLKLTDRSGKAYHIISGNKSGRYSRFVNGDYVKLEFVTDIETEGYGFDITQAAYR